MKALWLIQRCELDGGRLKYDYMGSTEFKVGDQPKSLKRIFAKGMRTGSATVNIDGEEVVVHMLAGEGFVFADYQQYLQQLAEHKLRLQEWTNFDAVVKSLAGIETGHHALTSRINVWFDFQNDVLWTLTEDNLNRLVSVLAAIEAA